MQIVESNEGAVDSVLEVLVQENEGVDVMSGAQVAPDLLDCTRSFHFFNHLFQVKEHNPGSRGSKQNY